jgi:hypothetical protein
MPDLKISQLPVASATTGAELFPVVQGGVTRQIALNAVRHIGSAVFDSSGNVGIGTASPLLKFQVKTQTDGNLAVGNSLVAGGVRVQAFNDAGSASVPLEIDGSVINFNISAVQRATLNASGNLGIGVTPSAWATANGQRALQITSLTALWTGANGAASLGFNAYESGVNAYTYSTANPSSLYAQSSGEHRWYTAPSGTAGNAISFTQAMTLDASGNLVVGATSASGKLESVSGGSSSTLVLRNSSQSNATYSEVLFAPFTGTTAAAAYIRNIYSVTDDSVLAFGTTSTNASPTERFRIKPAGQIRFVPLAAAPTNSVENGDVYYDSGTNKLRVRAAGAWVDLH